VGVPNVGGDLYRSASYNKNPLVNIACLGILKRENIVYGNAMNVDSVLIYVGSKTGNEGINGAAMASKSFTNIDVDAMQHNVQKSDPFLEKLLLEAC
jgi:phosphoribosylformylglycinamidine (FGAM) synthase-like enzyme